MNEFKKLSIVIPLYNEEKNIEKILDKILSVKLQLEKEINIVNDGSNDNSKEIVENYIKKHNNENINLYNKKNGGKGSALKLGFENSTGDILLIQDADLEYDPQDYPKLIKPIIDKKTEVVYGSRLRNKNNKYSHWSFLIGGLGVTMATNILYISTLTDEPTCYKVFHKKWKNILSKAEGNQFEWEPEITAKILRKGHKILEVPINYYPRKKCDGKKINFIDGVYAITTLIKWRFKKLK